MTCRNEVLSAAKKLSALSSTGEFTVAELVHHMQKQGSRYKEATIRTHVTSRMCISAPKHHGTVYSDLVRASHGMYRLAASPPVGAKILPKKIQPVLTNVSVRATNSFQRIGSSSNAAVGKQFEQLALISLREAGITVSSDYPVDVGVSKLTKIHRFDFGSDAPPTIVECKSHRWTKGNNIPSAKLTVWNEAMYYFACAPKKYRKIFFVLKDRRASNGETLSQYYIRIYYHLIPSDVEIWEFDEKANKVVVVHGED